MGEHYKQAARVLSKVLEKKASVKTALYNDSQIKNKKLVLAIVTKTLQNISLIQDVIKENKDLKSIKNKPLLIIMLNDFLTTGKISGGGIVKQIIIRNKDKYPTIQPKPQQTSKYYRLNTLRSLSLPLISNKVEQDEHIPSLYLVSPPLKLNIDSLVAQDKPSCFPAYVLNPQQNSVVIDACAAPGNKTTHLANIMNNTGTIYAFDKDKKRCRILENNVKSYMASNITVICSDFLKVDPASSQFEQVSHVLCDPSCSGSGILERINTNEKVDVARLRMLSSFQTKIVCHAMKFPNVQRITYSTCSIHNEENEEVVREILDQNPNFSLMEALPAWKRRGLLIDDKYPYQHCVRVDPKEDGMTGFFVALFVRND
ncbi:Methyltransferase NSUN5 [Entamoeba marina]